MSIDLVVSKPGLSVGNLSVISDQQKNSSGLGISSSPVATILGNGNCTLGFSTYGSPTAGYWGNAQIVATSPGYYATSLQFNLQPNTPQKSQPPTSNSSLLTIFQINPDGTLAAPNMPDLPPKGTSSDLVIDSAGKITTQLDDSRGLINQHAEAIAKLQSEVAELKTMLGTNQA